MLATDKDVQCIYDTTVQHRAINGQLTDVVIRETMGAYELGAVVNNKFYKSNLFKTVCYSLKEVGELMDKVKRTKSFVLKPKKTTKIRTF